MRIVIVGDGKVGNTLAEQLSGEGHDIVLIDHASSVLNQSVDALDIIGSTGNGAAWDVQEEAGVGKSDLLIAATSADEVNILCCMVARKLGAPHTIARVRNPAYLRQLSLMKEELGLSLYVNPEIQTAAEISRILRFPPALHIETFVRGRVELVETPVTQDSPLVGVYLRDLQNRFRVRVLICAVQRGEDVFIPGGNFRLEAEDRISITASPASIETFFRTIGVPRMRVRNVMIVGGGLIALHLSRMLIEMGMSVKIIEQDKDRCLYLTQELEDASVIHGDGTSQDLLDEEGIDSMDAFVALTGIDEENIVMSMYANSKGVKKIVTKVERIRSTDMLDRMGIGSVVSAKNLTANRILHYVRSMENATASGVETLTRMVNNRVEALEFRVRDNADFLGTPIGKMKFKKNLLIAAIVRAGRIIIPGAADTFEFGDSIVVVTTNEQLADLRDIFA